MKLGMNPNTLTITQFNNTSLFFGEQHSSLQQTNYLIIEESDTLTSIEFGESCLDNLREITFTGKA